MDLRSWIDQFPVAERRDARQRIAKALELTEPAVRHWANGTRQVPPEKARAISEATGGAVTLQELRPDVFGSLPPSVKPRRSKRAAAGGAAAE